MSGSLARPFAEVSGFILELEAELGLVDDTPGGFPLWPAIRNVLLQKLLSSLGVGQEPHLSVPLPRAERSARWLRSFTSENPFLLTQPVENLVLEHPRAVHKDGVWLDPHSQDWTDELRARGEGWISLSDPSPDRHSKTSTPQRASTTLLHEWARVEARLRRFEMPAEYRGKMRLLDERARSRWGVSWGAARFAEQRLRALRGRCVVYERLLTRLGVRRVSLVVGYSSNVAWIAAARTRGIPSSEIQHGAFSRYHLGYSYPGRTTRVPGCPDEFWAWNESWARLARSLNPAMRVLVREPSFLAARRAVHNQTPKDKTVLVLSQGLLGDAMAREFSRHIERFSGYQIRYKLHPGEYGREASYEGLKELVARGVVVLRGCDLDTEMARAEIVVGVYSTALYEAIELGARAYLLDLPGVETMQELIDEGRAEVLV